MHDEKAQHEAQLWVVKGLFYARPGEVAVGMEMFQRPYQDALDLYISGEIGEKALLRNSQYETRWGYDFSLYRGILRFALDHQVPVLALNSATETVRKLSSVGVEGLSPEEKAALPELDLSDPDHKAKVKAAYDAHPHGGNFDRFYAVQTLWDETMAETAAAFLRGPGKGGQIVVLAGHGHIDGGYGIPKRVARRVAGTHKIVVPLTVPRGEKIDIKSIQAEKLGDYLWFIEVEPEAPVNPHHGLPPGTPNPHTKKPGA
jgi:uncharacterized iron-regulated protein